MREILVLVAIVIGMLLAGWLTFHREDGKTTVTLETQKIEDDTAKLVHEGKHALDDATKKWQDSSASPDQSGTTPVMAPASSR